VLAGCGASLRAALHLPQSSAWPSHMCHLLALSLSRTTTITPPPPRMCPQGEDPLEDDEEEYVEEGDEGEDDDDVEVRARAPFT
jgi:hypothetical protein